MGRKLYSILLLIILFTISYGPLFAQRERSKEVEGMGTYVANEYETPAEAKAKALFRAKEDALLAAGVWLNISSVTVIEIGGSNGDNFRKINTELARFQIEGRVRLKEPATYTERNIDGHYEYRATIRAEVKMEETEDDRMFNFETKGLLSTYLEGQIMTFTITPTENCYLRIFYFDPSTNVQLYPVENVYKDIQFVAKEPVTFPLKDLKYLYNRFSEPQKYTMALTDEDKNIEQGVLIIIALKKPYPFTKEVTYENVLNWLFDIKRNEKREYWYGVNITKR